MQLELFEIKGLFERHDLTVPIRENKLVLVGENGSGKSTILGILFALLSQDWPRLADMPFQEAALTINGTRVLINRKQLLGEERTSLYNTWRFLESRVGPPTARLLRKRLQSRSPEYWFESPDELGDLADQAEVPQALLLELLTDMPRTSGVSGRRKKKREAESKDRLTDLVDAQILFLPTYRRIERDLTHIFPHMNMRDFQRRRRHGIIRPRHEGIGHIELVEFGMEDVGQAFHTATRRMDMKFRAELNRLTVEYLRDVLRGAYYQANYADELSAASAAVDAILKRVDDSILETRDIVQLRELISAIDHDHCVPEGKEVAAHFLSKLVNLHGKQKERELSVKSLTDTCNRYLTGKQLRFDPGNFTLGIKRDDPAPDEDDISPAALSSGEKQIVSLFTHLYLSSDKPDSRFFIIIDEPELSISVDWQRMFLPDILSAQQCGGLVAVTHSPFIFENSCGPFAHSIAEFLE